MTSIINLSGLSVGRVIGNSGLGVWTLTPQQIENSDTWSVRPRPNVLPVSEEWLPTEILPMIPMPLTQHLEKPSCSGVVGGPVRTSV